MYLSVPEMLVTLLKVKWMKTKKMKRNAKELKLSPLLIQMTS